MTESKPIEVVDWFGKWLDNGFSRELIEPSPEWIARQKEIQDEEDKPKPPTEIELVQGDVAFLAETVAISLENTENVAVDVSYVMGDSVILAETVSMLLDELELVKAELATLKGGQPS